MVRRSSSFKSAISSEVISNISRHASPEGCCPPIVLDGSRCIPSDSCSEPSNGSPPSASLLPNLKSRLESSRRPG